MNRFIQKMVRISIQCLLKLINTTKRYASKLVLIIDFLIKFKNHQRL